jgi:hypothetical protein
MLPSRVAAAIIRIFQGAEWRPWRRFACSYSLSTTAVNTYSTTLPLVQTKWQAVQATQHW